MYARIAHEIALEDQEYRSKGIILMQTLLTFHDSSPGDLKPMRGYT